MKLIYEIEPDGKYDGNRTWATLDKIVLDDGRTVKVKDHVVYGDKIEIWDYPEDYEGGDEEFETLSATDEKKVRDLCAKLAHEDEAEIIIGGTGAYGDGPTDEFEVQGQTVPCRQEAEMQCGTIEVTL